MICVDATCILVLQLTYKIFAEERRELSENVWNWRLLEALNIKKTRHFLSCFYNGCAVSQKIVKIGY